MYKKPELLAPAGDLEKLKTAIHYGADAVFLGGEDFGLRAASKNFSLDEIREGVEYAHDRNKKVYVTLNIVAHNEDLLGLDEYARKLYEIGVDAAIISDPGVFSIVKRVAPKMDIHISTQANITNYETIMFWYELGAKRVILARELSLKEIKEIREKVPNDMEIETFVHGAMCISYSGRCVMSNYMTGRDANRGECSHACRWKYNLVEEKRPGEYFPVMETDDGTFIFNSKDLCMIEYLEELLEAGVYSFKIEGRVKSAYYVSTVIRSYRLAIDELFEDRESYKANKKWINEIKKASHRDFTTGFYFGKPDESDQVYTNNSYIRGYDYLGIVLDYDDETKMARVEQRNRIVLGDRIEIFGTGKEYVEATVLEMTDKDGESIETAPHPKQIIKIKIEDRVNPRDMIRKEREDD